MLCIVQLTVYSSRDTGTNLSIVLDGKTVLFYLVNCASPSDFETGVFLFPTRAYTS